MHLPPLRTHWGRAAPACRRDREPFRHNERGAVAAFVATVLVVIVGIASFVVDLGMQRVVRSDMQALADAVAIDLARLVDGRSAADIIAGDDLRLALHVAQAESLDRNDAYVLGDPPKLDVALVELDADGSLVTVASTAEVKRLTTSDEVPNAVWVRASGAVDFALAPGSGAASRTAVGASQSMACLQVGSFAANLKSTDSAILDRYLNDALNITGIGYEGLADAEVKLGDLDTALQAGTTTGVLDVNRLRLADLFKASAQALQANGAQQVDIDVLNSLSSKVAQTLIVDLDSVVDVSTGNEAVLASTMKALDLVAISAFLANGKNGLTLPVLWNVPQFTSGETSLKIIEGPQRDCGAIGEAVARTAQVQLSAYPTLNVPTIAGLAAAAAPVELVVDIASAAATLTGITCGDGSTSPQVIQAEIERALSTARLDIPIQLRGEIKANEILLGSLLNSVLSSLGLGLNAKAKVDITINAGVTLPSPATSVPAEYAVPPHDYSSPEQVGGTGGYVLPHVSVIGADVTGKVTVEGLSSSRTLNLSDLVLGSDFTIDAILADLITKNVIPGINGFIDNVNTELSTLTRLLGLQIAGADLFGVKAPSCNVPALRG